MEGFLKETRDGKYKQASHYLDLGTIPLIMQERRGEKLANQLQIILDRALVIDPLLLSTDPKGKSEDGADPSFESLGRIKTPEKNIDILLQRVSREDGVLIWKLSQQTISNIPHLYKHYGYRPFEQAFSQYFPNVVFMGWQLWQYIVLIIGAILAYFVAYILSLLLKWFIIRRNGEEFLGVKTFRILLWFFLLDQIVDFIGPSVAIRAILQQDTLGIIALSWAAIQIVEQLSTWWTKRFEKSGQLSTIALLKPAKKFIKIIIIFMAVLIWLDNFGFNVKALFAGLGVGGVAVALAAQDTIKNLIGSMMIIIDKPYQVGQRIVVKGHDGVVEEIGLRSTKIRLLSGHQTIIPNEQMANTDIENIDRRNSIRRLFNISISYNTPLEKIEKAIDTIKDILDNHEGMDPEFTPMVYFNEFNRDSLNIIIVYWYHPADYYAFMAMSEKVNKKIMEKFDDIGIQFALPEQKVHYTQDLSCCQDKFEIIQKD